MSRSTKNILNVLKPTIKSRKNNEEEGGVEMPYDETNINTPIDPASMSKMLTKCLTRKDHFDLTPLS